MLNGITSYSELERVLTLANKRIVEIKRQINLLMELLRH